MLLRHLIVLIINARIPTDPLVRQWLGGQERRPRHHDVAFFDRSDQINQISRGIAVSPRGTGQTSSKPSLNDVEKSGRASLFRKSSQTLLFVKATFGISQLVLVEPIGIEPTT
jgi:hypothetical protein